MPSSLFYVSAPWRSPLTSRAERAERVATSFLPLSYDSVNGKLRAPKPFSIFSVFFVLSFHVRRLFPHSPRYTECVYFFPVYYGRQVRWMHQPGSHRRKVTHDFSSTFLLRFMPLFFSREGFSGSFPSSTREVEFCALTNKRDSRDLEPPTHL